MKYKRLINTIMIWSVSWRNIWRNRTRSIIVLSGIAVGIFAGVFIWAFYAGMVNQRINAAIKTEASNIQIHNKKYLEDPNIKLDIAEVNEKCNTIRDIPGVKAVSARTLVNAMVMSAETGAGVKIIGIDPDNEEKVTNMYQRVVEGKYFEGVKRNPILLGEKLAGKLNVKVRSKVVITLQQMDGTLTRDQFRVVGIYRTASTAFEEMNAFVRSSDLNKLINLKPDHAHEIAVLLSDNDLLSNVTDRLRSLYPNLDVQTWRTLMPDVSLVEQTMNLSMYIVMAIILVALLFAIINTMLMAVLERIKELGMLMAIGMNKRRVFAMIMLETVMLVLTGGVIGIIIGSLITFVTYKTGIPLAGWSEAYRALGFNSVVYPVINTGIVVTVTIMVIFTGMLASIYPAVKALSFKPAEALRIDV